MAHSFGSGAEGRFLADPAASELTKAPIFSEDDPAGAGEVVEWPVRIRFSNFASPARGRDDEAPGPRGLAIRLDPDGLRFDLVTLGMDRFFARNREDFVSFSRAMAQPLPIRLAWLGYLLVLGRTRLGVALRLARLGSPASYLGVTYHGVNSFQFVDADGRRTPIRYRIEPAPLAELPEPVPRGTHRLAEDLRQRLEVNDAYFDVMAVIGDGLGRDRIDDPMVPWPRGCRSIRLGTLILDRIVDDDAVEGMAFNPHNLCPGIEPSDDEILMARRAAYPASVRRRLNGASR